LFEAGDEEGDDMLEDFSENGGGFDEGRVLDGIWL
jgi:hypothetical protein